MNQKAIHQAECARQLVAAFKEKHEDCFRRHGNSEETIVWMWQHYEVENFAHQIKVTHRILAERIADDADDLDAFRWN